MDLTFVTPCRKTIQTPCSVYFHQRKKKVSTIPGLDPSDDKLGNIGEIHDAGSMHEFLVQVRGSCLTQMKFSGPKFILPYFSNEKTAGCNLLRYNIDRLV